MFYSGICRYKHHSRDTWVPPSIKCWLLILAQVIVSGLWDQAPYWAAHWIWSLLGFSLSICLSFTPLTFSLSLKEKKKKEWKNHEPTVLWEITLSFSVQCLAQFLLPSVSQMLLLQYCLDQHLSPNEAVSYIFITVRISRHSLSSSLGSSDLLKKIFFYFLYVEVRLLCCIIL